MGRLPQFKTEGNETAYIIGALCTQLHAIEKTPWCFATRDGEINIHLLERARACVPKGNLSAETNGRIERHIAAVERLIAAGKLVAE